MKHIITIFTSKTCPKCPIVKKMASEIASELNFKYKEVDIEEYMVEALQFQIASVPSVLFDNQVLFKGNIPTKEEFLHEVKKWMSVSTAGKKSKKTKDL